MAVKVEILLFIDRGFQRLNDFFYNKKIKHRCTLLFEPDFRIIEETSEFLIRGIKKGALCYDFYLSIMTSN